MFCENQHRAGDAPWSYTKVQDENPRRCGWVVGVRKSQEPVRKPSSGGTGSHISFHGAGHRGYDLHKDEDIVHRVQSHKPGRHGETFWGESSFRFEFGLLTTLRDKIDKIILGSHRKSTLKVPVQP